MAPVTSLSAGPERAAWALAVPAQPRRAAGGGSCRGLWLLALAEGAVSGALQADAVEAPLLARPQAVGRWQDPPSGAWRPRKSSLPFPLVLGTMPCRGRVWPSLPACGGECLSLVSWDQPRWLPAPWSL